jgi:hypothetical protein
MADIIVSSDVDAALVSIDKAAIRDSIAAIGSVITGITGAIAITNIVAISQADYDDIISPDANTFYVIIE